MGIENKIMHLKFNKALIKKDWVVDPVVTISGDLITNIQTYDQFLLTNNATDVDVFNATLMPGLIDTHIHGAMGCDVMDATHESLNTISIHLAKSGVVAFLATTVTSKISNIEAALIQVKKSKIKGLHGSELLGSYLEGPYFTELNRGAHPETLLRDIDLDEIKNFITLADGSLKVIALAPEKSDAIEAIKYLKKENVNVMLAHTNSGYEQTTLALNSGATGIVHCYNGMKGIHHRDVGTVGAGLTHPRAFVEIINDGHHVHSAAIDIAYRCCGERLLLISDSMQATGMKNGQYELGEYLVTMKDGVVRTDSGSLAGSTLNILDAVHNTVKGINIPLEKSWLLASLTPAKALKIDDQFGSLAIGKKASMVAINEQGEVLHTWVAGNIVYSK